MLPCVSWRTLTDVYHDEDGQYGLLKQRELFTSQHGVSYQKNLVCSIKSVRTSDIVLSNKSFKWA
jgi:hypothetical protein